MIDSFPCILLFIYPPSAIQDSCQQLGHLMRYFLKFALFIANNMNPDQNAPEIMVHSVCFHVKGNLECIWIYAAEVIS